MACRDEIDLDELLSPAAAFGHPSEVVRDPDLTLNEKRAVLASWASDARAIAAAPHLRAAAAGRLVPYDVIMTALRELDQEASRRAADLRARKAVRVDLVLRRSNDGDGRGDAPIG